MEDRVKSGMAKLCVLYTWPYSQKCMECANSCFVQGDGSENDSIEGSSYLCFKAERRNDGVTCPSFVEDESEEEQ